VRAQRGLRPTHCRPVDSIRCRFHSKTKGITDAIVRLGLITPRLITVSELRFSSFIYTAGTSSPKGIIRFWSHWKAPPYGEIGQRLVAPPELDKIPFGLIIPDR